MGVIKGFVIGLRFYMCEISRNAKIVIGGRGFAPFSGFIL